MRDAKLLAAIDPLAERISEREPVNVEEVAALAARPELRLMLYTMLKHFERLDLFPKQYLDPVAQAEGALAYWMLHPNEDQEVPERMELLERVSRDIRGKALDFYVFRYRMREGHWGAARGWVLGLAGPFVPGDVPYSGSASAFTGGHKEGAIKPAAFVDWFIGVVERKSGRK
jgi:hypothetical protein